MTERAQHPTHAERGLVERLRAAATILDKHPCEVVWLARDCREAAARIEELERALKIIPMLLTQMKESGSWDEATLNRVIENVGAILPKT